MYRECTIKVSVLGCIQEDVTGTLEYLNMCYRYAEIFIGHKDVQSKVESASFVCNFLRLWKIHISETQSLSVTKHFISKQCFVDIYLSCHFAVLLLRKCRDVCPSLFIELGLTGTDMVESFFSENGSFVMNKHTYSFNDMLLALSKMNALNAISSRGLVRVHKAHSKQEIVWEAECGESSRIIGASVPDDQHLAKYWENGLEEAQRKWHAFGMKDCASFRSPHCHDCLDSHIDYVDAEDVLEEYVVMQPQEDEASIDNAEIDCHMRQVMNDNEPLASLATIDVPEVGTMYKSTVVSSLNRGEKLSNDRLARVQSVSFIEPPTIEPSLPNDEVALFSDVIVRHKAKYTVGRIERMFRLDCSKKVELAHPVQMTCQNIVVSLKVYNSADNMKWFCGTMWLEVKVANIVAVIQLRYIQPHFEMEESDKEMWFSLISTASAGPGLSRNDTASSLAGIVDRTDCADSMVTTVDPIPGGRSKRRRRVVLHFDD